MRILAVSTATEACSAALLLEGSVAEQFEVAPQGHADRILPMLEALLSDADLPLTALDGIAFDRGPGSFTGVRIGTAVVQGLAFAADLPVAPVSSLAAIARGAWRSGGQRRILAAIDARMQEIYWGAFAVDTDGRVQVVAEERVCAADAVPPVTGGGWYGAGSGWAAYGALFAQRLGAAVTGYDPERLPHARDVAELGALLLAEGRGVVPEEALPVYLRDQVVQRRG